MQVLAALKEKSPTLHEKATKLHAFIKGKVDALGDEAKGFVKKVDTSFHAFYVIRSSPTDVSSTVSTSPETSLPLTN